MQTKKYVLLEEGYDKDVSEHQIELVLPMQAEVLHVGYQQGQGLCMWVLLNQDQPIEERRFFKIYDNDGIGFELTTHDYVGTACHGMIPEFWHVFELV